MAAVRRGNGPRWAVVDTMTGGGAPETCKAFFLFPIPPNFPHCGMWNSFSFFFYFIKKEEKREKTSVESFAEMETRIDAYRFQKLRGPSSPPPCPVFWAASLTI